MIHIRSLNDSLSERKGTLDIFFRDNVIGQLTINQSYPNKVTGILVGKLGHFYFKQSNHDPTNKLIFRIIFNPMSLLCTLHIKIKLQTISYFFIPENQHFFALFVICLLNVSNKSDNNH